MVEIKKPLSAWILARLYDGDVPTAKRELLRKLCKQSFQSMTSDTDFDTAINELVEANYLEYVEQTYIDHVPLNDEDDEGRSYRHMAKVEKVREGYLITDLGIIAFRRQIVTPIEKIVASGDYSTISDDKKLLRLFTTFKGNIDAIPPILRACIENAPEVLEFIDTMMTRLGMVKA